MSKEKSVFNQIIEALRRSFYFLVLFSVCINILMLTVPLYMLQIYDYVLTSQSVDSLLFLTFIAVFALVIFGLLDVARSRMLVVISGWLDMNISPRALEKSADEILQGRSYGGQALRDAAELRNFIGSPSIFALFDAPWVPIYILVIFLLHPVLGFIASFGAVLLFILAILNELLTRKLLTEAGQHNMLSQRHVDLSLRNAEVIQAMGMMPAIVDLWHKKSKNAVALTAQASKRAGLITSLSKFLRLVLQIMMLGVGAYLVINGAITAGVMIAGTILLSRALAPVEQSIVVWKQLQSALQAYQRLKTHFEKETPRTAGIQLPKPVGVITYNNVYYTLPELKKPIITKVSMQLNPGEILAMVGPSGSGKSTLARLMVGVWKPSSGSVRLDGADVYTWDRPDFGLHIGYLPQEVQLFAGTVKENIARLQDIDDEEVVKAAQLAGAHELILKFPQGYDTEINAGTFNLSGGQQQRLALARALYKNPQVMVLDEPNSHLDTEGEMVLMRTLLTLKEQGKTIFIISHRSSLLRHVDKIALMVDGSLKLIGPRDDILAKLKEIASQQVSQRKQKME